MTLHVGLDTFRPLAVDDLAEHRINGERYEVAPAAWERIGKRTFSASSDAFIMFSSAPNPPASPGFTRGVQRIAQTITMTKDHPDAFDSRATVEFFDDAGTQLLSACATAIGRRY